MLRGEKTQRAMIWSFPLKKLPVPTESVPFESVFCRNVETLKTILSVITHKQSMEFEKWTWIHDFNMNYLFIILAPSRIRHTTVISFKFAQSVQLKSNYYC